MTSRRPVILVDYGVGNLRSVSMALEAAGGAVTRTDSSAEIAKAERIVVPGVGAFGRCMEILGERGLVDPLREFSCSGRPMLGICVGMQMLLDWSDEFGRHEGLGVMFGGVSRIAAEAADGTPHKIPHIGWNSIHPPMSEEDWKGTMLAGTAPGTCFYFVHSFAAQPQSRAHVLASADYHGVAVAAVVRDGNTYGCQFHPEKSGESGLALLRAFLALE